MMIPSDWVLEYPGTEFAFGSVVSGFGLVAAPVVGSPDITDSDVKPPQGDGVMFGVDRFGGTSVTFELAVLGESVRDSDGVRRKLDAFRRAWRADVVRAKAGAVAVLRATTGRITYGRPRRFAPDMELLPVGKSMVVCDFATSTDLWYSPDESESEVSLVPEVGGGLVAPLAAPLATTRTSDRSTSFVVEGETPTWGVYRIWGPLVNPVLEVVGLFRLEFAGSLAFDEVLVIDTRPHARTVLKNGASVSLAPSSSRLAHTQLPPGRYELVLRGASDSGVARATARWRNAFTTY